MTRSNLLLIPALAAALLLASCSNSNVTVTTSTTTDSSAADPSTLSHEPPSQAPDLKAFMMDTQGAYGWERDGDPISLDFFPDGRLHIQGDDGEATMWEGTWSLSGDQLTMDRPDLGKKITVTAKVVGDNLEIDGNLYRRYLAH